MFPSLLLAVPQFSKVRCLVGTPPAGFFGFEQHERTHGIRRGREGNRSMAPTRTLLRTGEALLALPLSVLLVTQGHLVVPGTVASVRFAVVLAVCALVIWKVLDMSCSGLTAARRRLIRFLADWELLVTEMTPVRVPSRGLKK